MIFYSRKKGEKKGTRNNIPDLISFALIKNFLMDSKFEKMRKKYFISKLTKNQVNENMEEIKILFEEYKGLDIVTKQDKNGHITKFII